MECHCIILTEGIGVVGNRYNWSTGASSLDSFYHTLVLKKGESERRVTENHVGREMSENGQLQEYLLLMVLKRYLLGKENCDRVKIAFDM